MGSSSSSGATAEMSIGSASSESVVAVQDDHSGDGQSGDGVDVHELQGGEGVDVATGRSLSTSSTTLVAHGEKNGDEPPRPSNISAAIITAA